MKRQKHDNVCSIFGSNYGPLLSLLHLMKIIVLPAIDEGSQTDNNQRVRDSANARGAWAHFCENCWEETWWFESCEIWHCHATGSRLVTVYQDVSSLLLLKGVEECQSKSPLSWHLLRHIPSTVYLNCPKTPWGKCRPIFLASVSVDDCHLSLPTALMHPSCEMMSDFSSLVTVQSKRSSPLAWRGDMESVPTATWFHLWLWFNSFETHLVHIFLMPRWTRMILTIVPCDGGSQAIYQKYHSISVTIMCLIFCN